jgi:hypothetical protein
MNVCIAVWGVFFMGIDLERLVDMMSKLQYLEIDGEVICEEKSVELGEVLEWVEKWELNQK